jgi:predicted nucleotidyltransferase
MNHAQNITRIKSVYNALGDLKDSVIFVGGATISLYADREAPQVRETDDVDIVVQITSRSQYALLEQKLRDIGFQNVTTSGFVGRFMVKGIIVDVMPTEESILGFSNKWYAYGFKSAVWYKIDSNHRVKIFTAPVFIATKLEAFKNRGNRDGRTSADFEDIVFVLENRLAIWEEIRNESAEIKSYLHEEFAMHLTNPYLQEWLSVHSDTYPPSSYYIIQEMKAFVSS